MNLFKNHARRVTLSFLGLAGVMSLSGCYYSDYVYHDSPVYRTRYVEPVYYSAPRYEVYAPRYYGGYRADHCDSRYYY